MKERYTENCVVFLMIDTLLIQSWKLPKTRRLLNNLELAKLLITIKTILLFLEKNIL